MNEYIYGTITASANITLDSIPRASSVSAANMTMGSAGTISINRASSAFTHTLTYSFGNTNGTIATKTTATSVSWMPALSLASQIPNAISGTCTITCTTYNGNTNIGSKTCTLTLSIPASVKPTISSLTASRIDGEVPSTWGIYVQTKSKVKLTINGAAGSYGSTIKSYSITGGGYSGSASTLTTGFLNNSGTITFTETSYDVRYTLEDAFSTISVQEIVSTAAVVMDFKSGGKGVAIGKVSESDNTFEVAENWDVKVYGMLLKEYIQQFAKTMYPVGSIYMSVSSTNPSTYFGGTWVAWGSGRVPVGINTSDSNFNTVEKTGGASAVTLTTSQMPSHSHAKGSLATASAGAHTHNIQNQKAAWGTNSGNRVLIDATSGYTAVTNKTTTSGGAHTHTISGSTAAAGSGSAHNNLQPYIVCYMWKRTA